MHRRHSVVVIAMGLAGGLVVSLWIVVYGSGHGSVGIRAVPPIRSPEFAVELHDKGRIAWISGTEAMGIVAADVPLTRSIGLVSRCTQVLADIHVAASCGCTHVSVDKTRLLPGERATLTITYAASKGEGPAKVSLLVASRGESPRVPHRINLSFTIVNNQAEAYASAEPSSITVDQPWRPHISNETAVRLRFAPSVDLHSVQMSSPESYVTVDHPCGAPETEGERSAIVRVLNPPPGYLRGKVSVRFVAEGKPCQLVIPISGVIRPRYTVSPQIVTLGKVAAKSEANVELSIVASGDVMNTPKVSVEGDWVGAGIERASGAAYRVHLALGSPRGKYLAGRVLIGGDLGEPPVVVPVSGILHAEP